ncbi:mesoderm induction early response protein 1-like [Saccoglossus kowalevskii]|uniref:Mesoderm induction early response protein 1-like n=1 Tax=Saccoglossus kowalevskii TaxID=10224 RepID=A0ABM0M536_SACKO|nr:PREDICTED: mesoderm induction early response protein 1-like [Saccoglossus kowalevskii]
MAEPATSESSPDTDRDFDPTAEMLINDFDDERTMEEEEQFIDSGDSCDNELDALEKEGEMPLEHLLAMYRYSDDDNDVVEQSMSSEDESIPINTDNLTLDKEQIARDLLPDEIHEDNGEASNHEQLTTDLYDLVGQAPSQIFSRPLRSNTVAGNFSGSESEDSDYVPYDDWKKEISVGVDYQADVPVGLCKYDDAPAYENEDRLLWDPSKSQDENVKEYLQQIQEIPAGSQGVKQIPTGDHVRDDEQALYLLLQCGHNEEEALRRHKMQVTPPTDEMSLWSEEECRSFENGLRTYGKDFHMIQQHKVRTRSVGELVQFYYLWKKTERHDQFANQARLSKPKYRLHPGITDYMDRFLDDSDVNTTVQCFPHSHLLSRPFLSKPHHSNHMHGHHQTSNIMQPQTLKNLATNGREEIKNSNVDNVLAVRSTEQNTGEQEHCVYEGLAEQPKYWKSHSGVSIISRSSGRLNTLPFQHNNHIEDLSKDDKCSVQERENIQSLGTATTSLHPMSEELATKPLKQTSPNEPVIQ